MNFYQDLQFELTLEKEFNHSFFFRELLEVPKCNINMPLAQKRGLMLKISFNHLQSIFPCLLQFLTYEIGEISISN